MDVLFIQPNYPTEMRSFARGLSEAGARVWAVGDSPRAALPDELKQHLHGYLQVPGILNEADVIRRLEHWLEGRRPALVEGAWEPVTLLAARLRERWSLPGMSLDTVMGFRDKKLMHERIAKAGLRTAASRRADSQAAVYQAVDQLGLPVVLKPTAGAGGQDTWICKTRAQLDDAVKKTRHVRELVVEEFVTGEEYTYETLCVRGRPFFQSICRYTPNVLDARKNEWISPIIFCLRDLARKELEDGIALGHGALDALSMGNGMTHMEWFRQDNHRAIFGEMACRPPGAEMMNLMNFAWNTDLYRAWGQAVVGTAPTLPQKAPYNSAIIFKRAQGQGRIRAIHGLRAFVKKYGPHVASIDLLPIGAQRRDWTATFKGDGHLVVRHPDHDICMHMAKEAAATIHLVAA